MDFLKSSRSISWKFLSTLAIVSILITPLSAGLISADIFVNTVFNQTSATAPTSPAYYFFSIGGTFQNAGDFTSASATDPAIGSPQSLAINGTSFNTSFSGISSLATFNADYPTGTYTATATNSITHASQSGVINYTQNLYTSTIPALTGSTYTGLQGMNPAMPFILDFNSFTMNLGANAAYTFLTIYNGSNIVFTDGFLSPGTTSVLLPANTLSANTMYSFELNFDDRLLGTDGVNNVSTEQGFDMRTDGSFTTGAAIPEPGSLVLVALGLIGTGAYKRRGGPKSGPA
jgi:hypothetical protein